MSQLSLPERLLRRNRQVLVALIGLLFVLASLYTVFGFGMRMTAIEMTTIRGMPSMPAPGTREAWSLSYAILVFLMWWVMMVAMMLPSVSPTVLLNAALLRHGGRGDRVSAISVAFLGGYLLAWAVFRAVAAAVQWALEATGMVSASTMSLIDTFPGGLVLIVAGLFQFSPLKAKCLEHCRSPVKFLTERRRSGAMGAIQMGAEHGVYCLGCCWFLMALLFVGGIMNLLWIVGLAALVAFEKLTRYGAVISKLAGVSLATWGTLIVAGVQ